MWQIYFVAIIEQPNENQKRDGVLPKFVLAPKAVIACSDKEAILRATEGLVIAMNNSMEVIVRPF